MVQFIYFYPGLGPDFIHIESGSGFYPCSPGPSPGPSPDFINGESGSESGVILVRILYSFEDAVIPKDLLSGYSYYLEITTAVAVPCGGPFWSFGTVGFKTLIWEEICAQPGARRRGRCCIGH